MSQGERRLSTRREHRVPVRVFVEGDVYAECGMDAIDLCEEALFLRTDLLFSLGEELGVEFPFGGQQVAGMARVVRVCAGAEPGVAVRFQGSLAWAG